MVLENEVRIEHMTWRDVKEAVKEANGVALLPVGAVEEHGPHLPLGTDSLETIEIGIRAAREAQVVICPPIWYGNSRGFMDFPGTLTVGPDALKAFAKDILHSLLAHGFDKPVILDGHGGNYGVFDLLAEEIHLERKVLVCHVRAWDMATLPKPAEIPAYDGHGGYSETSVMMYLCPDDVHRTEFTDSRPEIDLTRYGAGFPAPSSMMARGAAVIPLSMGEMVAHGHHGDPSLATPERGQALIEAKTSALVEFLKALKANQIVRRRR